MNRSFTARLSGKTPRRLRDYLWATHRLFNESLAYLQLAILTEEGLGEDVTPQGNASRGFHPARRLSHE